MGDRNRSAVKSCAIAAAVMLAVPVLVVGVVGVKTWMPLREANENRDELERALGDAADYTPTRTGEVPAERMELFLELRASLVTACDHYGTVQKGFDSVASIESKSPEDVKDVGSVAFQLGGAALSITPFLAKFFELRNQTLLAASMGLQEYSYIYAVAYHDLLLSEQTRGEIFSDGKALSPEASEMLRACLERQLEAIRQAGAGASGRAALEAEVARMEDDPSRLVWQDALPAVVHATVMPYRDRLDLVFCAATAGLEMERDARRSLWIALE